MSGFIQVNLSDGRSLYTDWGDEYDEVTHRIRAFRSHLDNKFDSTFNARRLFIKGAPVYSVAVRPEHVVSVSVISTDWENILDEGQTPVYLYDDEIRALINASSGFGIGRDYTPPALETAIVSLEEALNDEDEGWH